MTELDLNLVRTFVLLYETRSVTATAETIHVTQPTVSYGLQKLRRRFGDELFRVTRSGLVPTAIARGLYEPLHNALTSIDEAVSRAGSFDPAQSRTEFTLSFSDLGEVSLLPRLMAELPRRAPGVRLRVGPLDVQNAANQLSRGEIDGFIASPRINSQRVARTPLFSDDYLAMVCIDHPRIRGDRLSLAELAAERHVTVFGPSGHDGPRNALLAHGLAGAIALEITRFAALPYLVQGGELVAIVPRYAGEVFTEEHRVRLVGLPVPIEPVEVSVYARHPHARSPAQQWLIDFMVETLAR
jgi:DNA-binding transcriptional LysR family regulator